MKFKAWHLFLMGVIVQIILLVILIVDLPQSKSQSSAQDWAMAFMMAYLVGTILISSIILAIVKIKIPQTGSIVLGLVIGFLTIVFALQIPEVKSAIGLITGVAVGVLFITAGIMSRRKGV